MPWIFVAQRINLSSCQFLKKSLRLLEESQKSMQIVTRESNAITNVWNTLTEGSMGKAVT